MLANSERATACTYNHKPGSIVMQCNEGELRNIDMSVVAAERSIAVRAGIGPVGRAVGRDPRWRIELVAGRRGRAGDRNPCRRFAWCGRADFLGFEGSLNSKCGTNL